MIDVVAHIELTNGEGLVAKLSVVAIPLYYRWYLPTDDDHGLKLLQAIQDDKHITSFLDTCDGDIISIQAITAHRSFDDVIGMSYEEAIAYVEGVEEKVIRKVLEDGKAYSIDGSKEEDRVNIWLAHDTVYRAELF